MVKKKKSPGRSVTKIIGIATASLVVLSLAVSAQTTASPNIETVKPIDIRPIAESSTGEPGWYRTVIGNGASAKPTDARANNAKGSLEFNITNSKSSVEVSLLNRLPSNRLADLSAAGLSYATWQTTGGPQAVSLQMNVDYDLSDDFTGWQGRLIFEPYRNNVDTSGRSITGNTWQSWSALEPEAVWWMTWSEEAHNYYLSSNPCPQSTPCLTAEFLDWYPNAGFSSTQDNALVLKAGDGWSDFKGYADAPYVGGAINTMWDFEPADVLLPTNKEQCKNDGWQNYTAKDGTPLQNQGQCVSIASGS